MLYNDNVDENKRSFKLLVSASHDFPDPFSKLKSIHSLT